jgi:diadenosine tetraphosphate (Ap4A) HIT family hydrolase
MMCIHQFTDEELFALQGCRSYRQYYDMRKCMEASLCIFCGTDMHADVLFKTNDIRLWHVSPKYMRKTLRYHFLIVPRRHIRFEAEMTDREYLDVWYAKRFLNEKFPYAGGMTFVREGDMRFNAGTVSHLHYNVFVPNETGEVMVPIMKSEVHRDMNMSRAEGFSIRYISGEAPS